MDKKEVLYPPPFPPPHQFPEPQQQEHTGEIPNCNDTKTLVPDPSDLTLPQQLTKRQQFPPPTVSQFLPPAELQPLMTSYITAPSPHQPNKQHQQQPVNTCIFQSTQA